MLARLLRARLEDLGDRAVEVTSPHLSPYYRTVVLRAVLDDSEAVARIARVLLADVAVTDTGTDTSTGYGGGAR